MIKKLLRFTFLLLLNQAITSTLHLSTENNHVLVEYAFKHFFARDWLNCIQACHDEERCISYNYERSKGANGFCELNDCGVEKFSHENRLLIYSLGFVYQQIRKGKQCLFKNCQEIKRKYPKAKSGVRLIDPWPNSEPIEVYCELDIAGGGFTFLPHSFTTGSDAQQIVDSLFKDKTNVLLKLKKKVGGSEWYTLIQPHPDYTNTDFGVLVDSYHGYTQPKNAFMKEYIFLGILPKSVANKKTTQGFRSNGEVIEFESSDGNPNSLFAFMPNRNGETPSNYARNLRYEKTGVAVDWRSNAKLIASPEHKMPKWFFFFTELHFGGGGCYTSSDRWSKFGFNSTAIGIR
ncbi:uncharacterized protein LOC111331702 [Stylophora pistillata]|uniref:uncharacterized protein LOC111331702 n=1 Tax=Stylophora pistillata TaxID=50429 RepID=UPI000C0434E0|nr:uncharacterized protein LOC111331702 [Stylophora pistillata]